MNGEVEYIIIGGNGKQYGPMNLETLKTLVRDERVWAETQVWDSTTREWHGAQQIEELSEFYPEESAEAKAGPAPEPVEYAEPHTSNLAIASMWCGIVAVPTFCCLWGGLGFLAVILGFVARREVKKYGYEGGTYANVGIICGFISLALTAILFLMFSHEFVRVIQDIFSKSHTSG